METTREKNSWELFAEQHPDLDEFQIADLVAKPLEGEVKGSYEYYKRCRAQSAILQACDYGVDEQAQDRILGGLDK